MTKRCNFTKNTRDSLALLASFLLVAVLLCIPTVSFAATADENVAKIQRAYQDIKDLKGSFIQKSFIKDLNKTETYKGDFYIKPPMKMKWIYGGKTAQDLIINNDTVMVINKGENQAYKSRFDKNTYGQTPVALLSGFGDIRDEFNASGKENTLLLRPKRPIGNVVSIKMVLSDSGFPIRSFEIVDSYSNEINIQLNDIRTNTGLKDSLFDLVVPKGMHIFEQ